MKKLYSFCLGTCIVLFHACQPQDTHHLIDKSDTSPASTIEITLDDFPIKEKLKGNKYDHVKIGGDVLSPRRMILADSILFLLESKVKTGGNYIKLYKFPEMEYIGSACKEGKGPGEVLGPWQMDFNPQTRSLSVLDIVMQRCTNYRIDSIMVDGYRHSGITTLPKGLQALDMVQVSDSLFVTTTEEGENRLKFANSQGHLVKSAVEYPQEGRPPKGTQEAQSSAYESYLTINPSKDKLVLATRYAGRIDVFSDDGTTIFTILGPFNHAPKYTIDEDGGKDLSEDNRAGYVELCATDNYLYALFSGRTREERFTTQAKYLFIFSWEGKPIARYELDRPTKTLVVDESSNSLVTLKRIGDYPLTYYNLAIPKEVAAN